MFTDVRIAECKYISIFQFLARFIILTSSLHTHTNYTKKFSLQPCILAQTFDFFSTYSSEKTDLQKGLNANIRARRI